MEDLHILGVDLPKRTFAVCGTEKQAYGKYTAQIMSSALDAVDA